HEIGARRKADHRDKSCESERLKKPQCRTRDPAEYRPQGSEPSENKAAQQHADALAEPQLERAESQGRDSDKRTDENAESDKDHVGDIADTIRGADRLDRFLRALRFSDDRKDISAFDDRGGSHWNGDATSVDAPKKNAICER